ncbi:MAG TPA: chloride channel protein, partial [Thiomonas arsenitoxydans]|nr:chloride channel protein [Thiomonas arsenitoxydans]
MTSALFGRLRLFWRNIDPMVPMTLVGAAVGFIAAIAVEGFRQAMYAVMRLYTEQEHLVAAAAGLPLWARVVIPTVGATLGGLIMWAGHRWIKRPRGPEYMEAVLVGDGRLPLGPNLTRTLSSLVGVSSGITIGREGTMIQFAALVSSLLGRIGK